MRLLVLSDLHVEFKSFRPPAGLEFDVVILAGDLAPSSSVVTWASSDAIFGPTVPIVIVPGNHEFYGSVISLQRQELQDVATRTSNVHVLDPAELRLEADSIRILGCTLWTDYVAAVETANLGLTDRTLAMTVARDNLADHRAIRCQKAEGEFRSFTPADAWDLHMADRAWLKHRLSEPFAGKTIVVTHHAPSMESIASKWKSSWLTPAFVSHLDDDFFEVAALWIHGHTHSSFDYQRGKTRVLCNPRGYPMTDGGFENAEFNPGLIIEV